MAALLACALLPAAAGAATIVVDTTSTANDDDGDCSLREAVTAANTDASGSECDPGSGHDTIVIPAGQYTLAGTAGEDANAGGDLDVHNPLGLAGEATDITFDGAGDGTDPAVDTIIDANDLDRAIHVLGDVTNGLDVTISELRIVDGSVLTAGADGGAIFMGDNNGVLTVERSTIEGSDAADDGGAIEYPNATLGQQHWVQIVDSELVGNTAGDWGGALNLDSPSGPDPDGDNSVEILRSTLTGNHAGGEGGAVYLENAPRVDLLNSTVTGNTSGGGGSAVAFGASSSELHVQFSTIANNSTTLAGGAGGIQTDLDLQRVYLQGALVAGNTGPGEVPANCGEIDGMFSDGVFESTSYGYSLDTGASCGLGDAEGDLSNAADPVLGALAANGGHTRTMALGIHSSAADRIPNSPDYCRVVDSLDQAITFDLTIDQRGAARPADASGKCDVGAYETSTSQPTTPPAASPPKAKKCKKKKKKKRPATAAAKKKKGCKKKKRRK